MKYKGQSRLKFNLTPDVKTYFKKDEPPGVSFAISPYVNMALPKINTGLRDDNFNFKEEFKTL